MKNSSRFGKTASASRLASAVLMAAIATVGWSSSVQAAACLEEAAGDTGLNCTANDVDIANITVGVIIDNCDGTPGDTFTFDGFLNTELNSSERYDIGFYIGADPLESTNDDCSVAVIPQAVSDIDGDFCGDVSGALQVPVTSITAPCQDSNGDGFFDVNTCSVWDNGADADNCNSAADALPGTKAKCNCEIVETTLEVPFCETNADCDDQNVCTTDICNTRESGLGDLFGCSYENNTASCDDGLFCNGPDVCEAGDCVSPGDPCAQGDACGTQCNEDTDDCFVDAGTICRAATGVCDTAETCTGSDLACPSDAFLGTATTCRGSNGVCDVAEVCSGTDADCPDDSFAGDETVCRGSVGVCDVQEVCSGEGAACPGDVFVSSDTVCRASGGVCDVAESCTGTSGTCPANSFQPTTITCRQSAGICDVSEACTGNSASCPADTLLNASTTCRASAGVCDAAEVCNGSSPACPFDFVQPTTTTCRAAAGVCDVAETCNGEDTDCPADTLSSGNTCRGSAGVCDVAETCTGSAVDCPANDFVDGGTLCRGAAGVCDIAESCTGSTASCPEDAFDAVTTCRDSAGPCDTAETCAGNSADCPADVFQNGTTCRAANGVCDVAETCSGSAADCPADGVAATTVVCRASVGVCDGTEFCTGEGTDCPADVVATTSQVCRPAAGVCDVAETCDGSTGVCPSDAFSSSATTCRGSNGVCDVAETCTGNSATCPTDAFQSSATTCRGSNGVCDIAETCSGNAATCPADAFRGTSTTCRAAADICDVAEVCSGNNASCPANGFKPAGTACTSDNEVCTNDVCNASGVCTHPNNSVSCDDGLFCTVNDTCSQGECEGTPRQCGDEFGCTADTCSESLDACVNTPRNEQCADDDACTTDICDPDQGCRNIFSCVDICRRPGWYGKHAGEERGENLVQQILDSVGGIEVCGQTITETSNLEEPYLEGLGLDSALEGLCVKVEGVEQRKLYRELVATALNCAMSGGVDNCDLVIEDFVDPVFEDCNDFCASGADLSGDPENDTFAEHCIRHLDCYNSGGRIIDGRCAYGTCDITEALCGGDYGVCPPFGTVTFPTLQTCERFPDNCRDEDFCNNGLEVCPDRTPASSGKACREAKRNECTIDFCSTSTD